MIDETWLGTSGDTCSIGDCCCGIGTGEAAGGGTKGSADGTGTGAFMAGRSRLGVGSMNAHGSKQLMDARPNCLWNQQSFDADCWLDVVLARETRGTGTMSFGTRFVLDTGLRADDEARAGGAEAEALLDEALRLVDARLSTGWAEETFLFVAVDEMWQTDDKSWRRRPIWLDGESKNEDAEVAIADFPLQLAGFREIRFGVVGSTAEIPEEIP